VAPGPPPGVPPLPAPPVRRRVRARRGSGGALPCGRSSCPCCSRCSCCSTTQATPPATSSSSHATMAASLGLLLRRRHGGAAPHPVPCPAPVKGEIRWVHRQSRRHRDDDHDRDETASVLAPAGALRGAGALPVGA
jgi:hypothetical protein